MLIRLRDTKTNNEFASTFTGSFNSWHWITECVSERFECDPDDVHTLDTDDAMDLITVKGEVVARIERRAGWEAMGVG